MATREVVLVAVSLIILAMDGMKKVKKLNQMQTKY